MILSQSVCPIYQPTTAVACGGFAAVGQEISIVQHGRRSAATANTVALSDEHRLVLNYSQHSLSLLT